MARSLKMDRYYFLVDGKPKQLWFGEMDYFRIPRENWDKCLDQLKAMGIDGVSIYVAWISHERNPGDIDFTGNLDLDAFLSLIEEKEMFAWLRPGPYVYAELRFAGIPPWLAVKHPEVLACRWKDGKFEPLDEGMSISYLHPTFLQYVDRWYSRVIPIIVHHSLSKGGCVVSIQLCNEISGIHIWFGGIDQNPEVCGYGNPNGRFVRFLRDKYQNIENLNSVWGTNFESFESILPKEMNGAKNNIMVEYDEKCFYYRRYIPEYIGILSQMAQKYGATDIPLSINIAGPSDVPLFSECSNKFPEIYQAIDLYYDLHISGRLDSMTISYDSEYGSELCKAYTQGPPGALEYESGIFTDIHAIDPKEQELWMALGSLNGLKLISLFQAVDGIHAPWEADVSGVYNYHAPIKINGQDLEPHYYNIQKVIRYFDGDRWFLEAEKEYDLFLGVYDSLISDVHTAHLLFRGNITFGIIDLVKNLPKCSCLWVNMSKIMPQIVIDKLVEYVHSGGKLILTGEPPIYNEQGLLPNLLERLGIKLEIPKSPFSLIQFNKDQYVRLTGFAGKIFGRKKTLYALRDFDLSLAVNETGQTVIGVYRKDMGEIAFGTFMPEYVVREHKTLLLFILQSLGIEPLVKTDRLRAFILRNRNTKERRLCVINYWNQPIKETIQTLGEKIEIEVSPVEWIVRKI
ncbi:MAG: beta-galactosidase [bacterium]|nr:beta-galactosidase [bacterium]